MLKVKINDEYNLYKKHTFEFNEGLTCLIGRNGAGKTTLLKEIKYNIGEKNVFYYTNEDSEKFSNQSFLECGNIQDLVRNVCSSEGQNIQNNFYDITPKIRSICKKMYRKRKRKCNNIIRRTR